MNGPVSVGYTCAALWFSVLVILNAHRHAHKCALMLEYIDCLFYGRSQDSSRAFTRPSYHVRQSCIL